MRLFVLFVCTGIVVVLTSGCTPSVPKAPPLAKVSGTVKLDGQPMKTGEIEFETEQKRRNEGIPLNAELQEELRVLGAELGLKAPF